MPLYKVILTRKAQKQLDKLSDIIAKPILSAIAGLELNPRPPGYKKLRDRAGYRIRVGAYRIIYDIFDDTLIVDIIEMGHRKDVYS